jgi:hypothetical protein
MEYTSRSLEIVSKRNITPEMIIKLRNLGNLRKNVRQVTNDWQIEMPDEDEIDDIEEGCVDEDSPPPKNRQRLSC